MKNITATIGILASAFAMLLGGWDESVVTLIIFMGADYILGMIVAGVFHKSPKSESGTLESRAGWKGICKKCVTLLFVMIGARLDVELGTGYIRDSVCFAFITNEVISIIENAGLMGMPIPAILTKAIEILREKGELTHDGKGN